MVIQTTQSAKPSQAPEPWQDVSLIKYFLPIFVYREDPEWAPSRYAFENIKEGL